MSSFGSIPVFSLEKQNIRLNFKGFFNLRNPLVATFGERHAPTTRKHLVKRGLPVKNLSKTFETFWSYFFVFSLEKRREKLIFKRLFSS